MIHVCHVQCFAESCSNFVPEQQSELCRLFLVSKQIQHLENYVCRENINVYVVGACAQKGFKNEVDVQLKKVDCAIS